MTRLNKSKYKKFPVLKTPQLLHLTNHYIPNKTNYWTTPIRPRLICHLGLPPRILSKAAVETQDAEGVIQRSWYVQVITNVVMTVQGPPAPYNNKYFKWEHLPGRLFWIMALTGPYSQISRTKSPKLKWVFMFYGYYRQCFKRGISFTNILHHDNLFTFMSLENIRSLSLKRLRLFNSN